MRVSERQRYAKADLLIGKSRADNSHYMNELTTQKKVHKISDDPNSIGQIFLLRDRSKSNERYLKNIDYARSFISRTETALKNIHDSLIRARELAVNLANDTFGGDSRMAASREIRQIIETVKGLANTKFGDRFVFSGFRTTTPSVGEDGNYLGDDGEIFLQVGGTKFQKINVTARELFEPNVNERADGRVGLLQSLDVLFSGLVNNDKDQIYRSMTELDNQLNNSAGHQATLGALYNALDISEQRIRSDDAVSKEALSKLEDADFIESTSNFKKSEAVLQSTLMASNKMLQPSLLNFMQ
jgi:flagellar hook-associated protein 3 FlgL